MVARVIVVVTIDEVCQIKNNSFEISFLFSGMNRGGGGNMNGNRNGFNNNTEQGSDSISRHTRFSAKRSRSRSPVSSTHGRLDSQDTNGTHNNNHHGNDYKRPRIDTARPPHVSFIQLKKRAIQLNFCFRKNLAIHIHPHPMVIHQIQ
jgi:hypothetical protein